MVLVQPQDCSYPISGAPVLREACPVRALTVWDVALEPDRFGSGRLSCGVCWRISRSYVWALLSGRGVDGSYCVARNVCRVHTHAPLRLLLAGKWSAAAAHFFCELDEGQGFLLLNDKFNALLESVDQ